MKTKIWKQKWNKYRTDMMDEKDEFFQENSYKNILIEYLTDFNSSNYLCQAFGGKLLVPKTDQELKEVASFIDQSETCSEAFLGLMKDLNPNPPACVCVLEQEYGIFSWVGLKCIEYGCCFFLN